MKKLMMAMVAAAMVGAANAETSYNLTAYNLDPSYNGYTLVNFCFTPGSLSDLNSLATSSMDELFMADDSWTYTEAKSWTEHYETLSSWYSQGEIVGGSSSMLQSTWGSAVPAYSVVFGVFEDGITAGSKYKLLETVYYDGTATMDPTFDMKDATVIKSGRLNIPEPTSGLLMLLGMAGLALKRKRA